MLLVIGVRKARTRARNFSPSNVKAAPRRAAANAGSGISASCARVRWYPSMGRALAIGVGEAGFSEA